MQLIAGELEVVRKGPNPQDDPPTPAGLRQKVAN
jgi:hypothetical protein